MTPYRRSLRQPACRRPQPNHPCRRRGCAAVRPGRRRRFGGAVVLLGISRPAGTPCAGPAWSLPASGPAVRAEPNDHRLAQRRGGCAPHSGRRHRRVYNDFAQRSQPFVEVLRHAKASTVGTITEAGLQTQTADTAQALVAVSVQTSNAGEADPVPRAWRMRITVQRVGDRVKVSDVGFVP